MATTRKSRCWETLLILLSTVPVSRSETNVALFKRTEQISEPANVDLVASKVVDGCTQTTIESNCCTYTQGYGAKQVWWRVDLSALVTIKSITIYYRDNFQQRFAGYQLYLSNTTESPTQGVLCYQDTSSTRDKVQLLVTHQCPYVAQYVTVYNYRNNPKRYSWYDDNAILELCEVQAYDCVPGKYGDYCNNDCSSNCKDSACEKETGHCFDAAQPTLPGSINMAAVGIGLGSGVVILALIVLVIVLVRRLSRYKSDTMNSNQRESVKQKELQTSTDGTYDEIGSDTIPQPTETIRTDGNYEKLNPLDRETSHVYEIT